MVIMFATALLIAGVVGIGLAPILAHSDQLRSAGVAFAAGTLLSMILLHVMPEAFAAEPDHAAMLMVLGFIGMMAAHQRGLSADPCCGHEHVRRAGLPSFLAVCLCSLNDGIILSADIDRGLGSSLLWALCIHKVMASFALFVLLKEVGLWKRRTIGFLYMGGYLLVTPIALFMATQLAAATEIWGMALALAAGALLYVVAGSLVPRVEHLAREGPALAAFIVAVMLSIGSNVLGPHTHPTHAHSHSHEVEHGK